MSFARTGAWPLAVLLLAGCSRPPPPTPEPAASPGARALVLPSAIPEGPETPPDETYEVTSPGGELLVTVTFPQDTGTSHFAEQVTVKRGLLSLNIVSTFTSDSSPMTPLVERILPLGGDRFLLLGWSSWGAGQQANHALLIEASSERIVQLDELISGTHRAHAALFVQTQAPVAVGVPADALDAGDSDRWTFRTRNGDLDPYQFGRLKTHPLAGKAPGVVRYTPPFHQRDERARQIVWFRVARDHFEVPGVLVNAEEHLKVRFGEGRSIQHKDNLRVDLDGDGRLDTAYCITDASCLALSPCASYELYAKRPGGDLFVGSISSPAFLANGRLAITDRRTNGFQEFEVRGGKKSTPQRFWFERGQYRSND